METLLTFTGFHDPFAETSLDGDQQAGPILTVLNERAFDRVALFSTPRLAERTQATREAISQRHPEIEVEVLETPLSDPTNYLGILTQLRKHFRKLSKRFPGARYSISVSSGTPHMHASWILLAASGEIPARILQPNPPQFVPEGKSAVREIDVTQKEFPQITKLIDAPRESETDVERSIFDACREVGIVGEDPAFLKALREAQIYAQYDDTHVLLLGETGSGKELLARFIHRLSRRAARPLVTVNCGSIPENLVESHLFGHKKGAFTGAYADAEGKFKAAEGGVIFLDELGELPLSAQAKLLRTLENGEIEPVGTSRPQKVNVKVIAATNRDLLGMVRDGTYREDLYQRFGSIVEIPSLRERRMDIPQLSLHLLAEWNAKHRQQRRLGAEAIQALTAYHWPGNIRELRRVITQSAMLVTGKVIRPNDLRFDSGLGSGRIVALPEPEEGFVMNAYFDELKDKLIERALEKTDHVQSKAAKLLGITPQAVSQYLKQRERKQHLKKPSTAV